MKSLYLKKKTSLVHSVSPDETNQVKLLCIINKHCWSRLTTPSLLLLVETSNLVSLSTKKPPNKQRRKSDGPFWRKDTFRQLEQKVKECLGRGGKKESVHRIKAVSLARVLCQHHERRPQGLYCSQPPGGPPRFSDFWGSSGVGHCRKFILFTTSS